MENEYEKIARLMEDCNKDIESKVPEFNNGECKKDCNCALIHAGGDENKMYTIKGGYQCLKSDNEPVEKPKTRRNYSSLDLVRFHNFALENPDLKPVQLVEKYNETYPELTAKEKLENLKKFFDL